MSKKANPAALLPILVFLVLYLGLGLIFEYVLKIPMGFYSIPIVVIFLIALLVGDRIYTDIASGANAGIDTLLVLSGETKEEDLPTADPQPTFVLPDVAALLNILES